MIYCFSGVPIFIKKTGLKPKASHQRNEKFALQTQFPFVSAIVSRY